MASQIYEENPFVSNLRRQQQELQTVSEMLIELPKSLEKDIMLPINGAAFVPAQLYHTNEILVTLGEFFVKRTASQAHDIAARRIKNIDKMIEDLENQNNDNLEKLKQFSEAIDQPMAKAEEIIENGENVIEIREEYDDKEEEIKRRNKEIERKKKIEKPESKEAKPRPAFEETAIGKLFEKFEKMEKEPELMNKEEKGDVQIKDSKKKNKEPPLKNEVKPSEARKVQFSDKDIKHKEKNIETKKVQSPNDDDEDFDEAPKKLSRFKQEMMKKNNK